MGGVVVIAAIVLGVIILRVAMVVVQAFVQVSAASARGATDDDSFAAAHKAPE